MNVTRVILNKCEHGANTETLKHDLGVYPIWRFPLSDASLTGFGALEGFLRRHPGAAVVNDTLAA